MSIQSRVPNACTSSTLSRMGGRTVSRYLRWGLLCLLGTLVLGLGERGVRADEYRLETDYILCPAHLRVPGPQELRAARTLKAELRVSWAIPPHLTADSGAPLDGAALTVIADDGARPVVQHRPPVETTALLHLGPRSRDLEVAAAWTRQGHVISDIQRVRLKSTQTRTGARRAPARTQATVNAVSAASIQSTSPRSGRPVPQPVPTSTPTGETSTPTGESGMGTPWRVQRREWLERNNIGCDPPTATLNKDIGYWCPPPK